MTQGLTDDERDKLLSGAYNRDPMPPAYDDLVQENIRLHGINATNKVIIEAYQDLIEEMKRALRELKTLYEALAKTQ